MKREKNQCSNTSKVWICKSHRSGLASSGMTSSVTVSIFDLSTTTCIRFPTLSSIISIICKLNFIHTWIISILTRRMWIDEMWYMPLWWSPPASRQISQQHHLVWIQLDQPVILESPAESANILVYTYNSTLIMINTNNVDLLYEWMNGGLLTVGTRMPFSTSGNIGYRSLSWAMIILLSSIIFSPIHGRITLLQQ